MANHAACGSAPITSDYYPVAVADRYAGRTFDNLKGVAYVARWDGRFEARFAQ
jgi:hypothetical protein